MITNNIAFILGDLLHLSPSETILFQKSTNNEFVGNVEILNVYKKPVTYKVSDLKLSYYLNRKLPIIHSTLRAMSNIEIVNFHFNISRAQH